MQNWPGEVWGGGFSWGGFQLVEGVGRAMCPPLELVAVHGAALQGFPLQTDCGVCNTIMGQCWAQLTCERRVIAAREEIRAWGRKWVMNNN